MRITAVETIRPPFQPNLCILRVETDEGLVGLGEAYYSPEAVEVYLHSISRALFDLDDPNPELVARTLTPYVGYQAGGVETRALGALDIALWDLLGVRSGLPVARLLGGPVHASIPIYNTCAGPGYVRATSRQHSSNWGVGGGDRYEDLQAFLADPAGLTADLLDEGIHGMKVWPFDRHAERSIGNDIAERSLAEGMRVVEQIRSVAGPDEMSLMIELHGLWNRPSATKIIRALEPYEPFWVEDPVRADAIDAIRRLRDDIAVPLAMGETATGTRGFLPLLAAGVDVVTVDAQWTGGLTYARRVASLADAHGVPIAPHDCTGPITFAAVCHLTASQPNSLVQETVRAFLRTWYGDIATGLPDVSDGTMKVGERPGLGVTLSERLDAPDVSRRTTRSA